MIICPNCNSREVEGAIFCRHCGAQMNVPPAVTTHKIVTAETRLAIKSDTAPFKPAIPDSLNSWVSLHIMESGKIIPLTDRMEFTIGRNTEGQPVMPDVDLSAYNAYANGVSRLHAVLKRVDDRAILVDLNSSNGTYVNGTRLAPQKEIQLHHGDVVHIGKLKLQVLFGLGVQAQDRNN